MAIIKCKMCGGDMELSADKTFGTCEYCGSTMTLPKVDDDQRAAAFNRGNHFRRIGEFDKALAVYERIVAENDADAEAHWCCALCRFGIEYVEDPATYEWIPTCHRASFDSFLEDVDYLAALEHSDGVTRRQYQKDAAKIAEVQKGILATSQNEEPFDVFICYKESDENGQRTKDSLLAQDIYYQLTDAGYRVFFSRITLEDKVGTQYEPYIFAALNSAKIMVAVGTKTEYFNAVWVKNEWSRFLALMKKDRTKLLLPCYRDMDPYDLPEQLSVLQSYDMGKIGFIQDLIRGVKKVLDGDKKSTVKETVVVQQGGEGGKTAALVERGCMALEDGDWAKADGFFEEVLNNDARNAKAYLGKALAQERCKTLEAFVSKRKGLTQDVKQEMAQLPEDEEHIKKMLGETAIEGYVDSTEITKLYQFDRTYQIVSPARKQKYQGEQNYWASHKQLTRVEQFAEGETAKQFKAAKEEMFRFLDEWIKQGKIQDETAKAKAQERYAAMLTAADEKARSVRTEGEQRREDDYRSWSEIAKNGTDTADLRKTAESLSHLNGYKDSAELAALCQQRADAIEAAAAAEAERQRTIREKEAKARAEKNKKTGIIAGIVAVIAIAVVVVVTQVIIPNSKYQAAENLFAAGQYEEALAAFEAMGNYKDAQERIPELYYAQAEKLLAEGEKVEAALAFGSAGDYLDAKQRGMEIWDTVAVRNTVSAGSGHTVGLKSDGTVVAVGRNDDDECNVSDWTDIVAISAGACHTVGLKSDGTVVTVGINHNGQCDVSDWTDIVAISAGNDHTVGLKSDGTVVAVGYDGDGQCDVSGWSDIVAISAGGHTVGLRSDGTVVAVGDNYDGFGDYCGQCDVSDWTDIVAISAAYNRTVGLKSDGTVAAVGYNKYGQCDVSGLSDIVAISAEGHTVGLKSDGTVVAVGLNHDGECDVSDWTGIKLPNA